MSQSPALDLLLDRRSVGQLEDPAPQGAELDLIIDAALRAPDHGRLRPWRFVVIRGDMKRLWADIVAQAIQKRDPPNAQALVERYRAFVARTPLLIAMGAKVKTGHAIPESEQLLSAGAAAMNMLNAIHMLGYAGMWVTGPNSYDPRVNAALGFHAPDRLVGFLAVGTAKAPVTAERPDRAAHVSEWRPA